MKRLASFFISPLFWALLTCGVAAAFSTPWIYPGEGLTLLDHLLAPNLPTSTLTTTPLAAILFRWAAPWLTVSLMHGLTLLCAGGTTYTLIRLLTAYTDKIHLDNRAAPYLTKAKVVGTLTLGILATTSAPLLFANSHFQWHTFDLLILLLLSLTLLSIHHEIASWKRYVWGICAGIALFSSCNTFIIIPLLIITAIIRELFQNEKFLPVRAFMRFLLPTALGILIFGVAFFILNGTWQPSLISLLILRRFGQLLSLFNGPWILIAFIGIVPFILALLGFPKLCANNRTFSSLFTYLTCAVLILLAAPLIPISPFTLIPQTWGSAYPLLIAEMLILAMGFFATTSVFLASCKVPSEGGHEQIYPRALARFFGKALPLPLLITIVTLNLIPFITKYTTERPLLQTIRAQTAAFLTPCQGEFYLLGDHSFDAAINLFLRECHMPQLTFIPAHAANSEATTAILRQHLTTSSLFKENVDLCQTLTRALDIGIYPFIQDWMAATPDVATQHFATLSNPNLWYAGNLLPIPTKTIFRGYKSRTKVEKTFTTNAYVSLLPDALPEAYTSTIDENVLSPALLAWRKAILNHHTLILNNIAVYLARANRSEEAYALFRDAYAKNNANVSALLNCFSLINNGIHMEDRDWVETEMRTHSRRLSRTQPEASFGFLLDVRLALLTPRQEQSIKSFDINTETSPDAFNRAIQAALQQQNLPIAERILLKGESVVPDPTELAYARALLHAQKDEPEKARAVLKNYITIHPKELEANTMLATLQLEANEIDDVRKLTLPRIIASAGTRDNYFVQIILGQLADKENKIAEARTAYISAYRLNPNVTSLRDTILAHDMRLNDRAAARKHAKEYLTLDRKHPFSNYIMGSLALNDNDLPRALSYLLAATSGASSFPEAYNDLAETYRRMQRWDEALVAARQAIRLAPHLPIVYETAAAALLGLNRYDEAHATLNQAEELHAKASPEAPIDARILITRARIQAAQNHPELAQLTLLEAKKQYDTLDTGARQELDALLESLQHK